MAIITISRQYGTGGRPLGRMIAKKLGYELIDAVVIQEIAEKSKVTQNSVKAMEREAGGWISQLIAGSLSRDYMVRLTGGKGYLDVNSYVQALVQVIQELAERDNIVFLGRGAQYVLQNVPNTFHFLLVAAKPDRIKFIQQFYRFSDDQAYQAILEGDKRRAKLFSKLGKSNYNDPALYHMVLNMSRLSLDLALAQVCKVVMRDGIHESSLPSS